MSPGLTRHDTLDYGRPDVISSRHCCLLPTDTGVRVEDVFHLRICQCSTGVSLASPLRGLAAATSFGVHIPVIISERTKPEVIWSHASWCVACVANGHSVWDGSVSKNPRETVRCHHARALSCMDIDSAVALAARGAAPQPTAIRHGDMRPQSLGNRGDRINTHREPPTRGVTSPAGRTARGHMHANFTMMAAAA